MKILEMLVSRQSQPVDGASLAFLRITLGLLLIWEVLNRENIFALQTAAHGLQFRYFGFSWLPAMPDQALLFRSLLGFCGVLMILGVATRVAAFGAVVIVAYGFLLVPENYLNHIYLFMLYLFLVAVVPCEGAFSLARYWTPLQRWSVQRPATALDLLLLRVQTDIVLIYAGLVKLNADWLNLIPLRAWLLGDADRLFYREFLQYDWVIAAANHGVIALHVLGAPLLFFQRTRLPVFLLYCAFHVLNHHSFNIGIFPWMTIAASTLFFAPDWPRRMWAALTRTRQSDPQLAAVSASSRAFALFVMGWLVAQALLPLRHYLYPGDVGWTYEGHRFAWRMKLVDREPVDLLAVILLSDSNRIVVSDLFAMLGEDAHTVATRPDLALQAAHQMAAKAQGELGEPVSRVHLYNRVMWNFRPSAFMIDPKQNLLEAQDSILSTSWIVRENLGQPMTWEAFEAWREPDLDVREVLDAAGLNAWPRCRLSDREVLFLLWECEAVKG